MSNRKPKTRCFSMDNKYNDISTPTTADMIKNGSLLALSAGNAFSNYAPVVGAICGLCEMIIKLYDTIKENKVISRALINRVELAHVAVKQMEREKEENEENFRKESYFKAFNRLEVVLKNIETFIKDISNYGGFRKFINADHIKKCYNDLVRNLEGACADLQFNVILSSYHTMREQDNNTEGYFAKIWEKLENVETMQHSELVLIKKLNKCLVSDNVEFNPIIKLAKIDPKDIDDVKSNCRKSTDLRGANNRIVKKILRKTVEVACKNILNYPRDDDTSESKKFQAKLAILNAIQCKYIIKFYGISNVNSHDALIFGWAEKGNLKDLYNTHYIDWVTKLKISYDVIRGLLFMHSGEILHHNVKCENILIDENGSAKVSNFELSRNLSGETTILSDLNDYIRWMAPEKMGSKTQRYNLYCEMFSFGMFLWELAYQQIPYNEMNVTSISDHVLSGQRESIKIGVHNTEIQQVLIQIINRAWEHSPYSRPSFAEITDELAELWKSFESIKYVAKFIAKDEVSSDEIQHYNIDEDSDFE
ncbi:14871_t:CDS:2, partial [Entrophospora sp. SA101]